MATQRKVTSSQKSNSETAEQQSSPDKQPQEDTKKKRAARREQKLQHHVSREQGSERWRWLLLILLLLVALLGLYYYHTHYQPPASHAPSVTTKSRNNDTKPVRGKSSKVKPSADTPKKSKVKPTSVKPKSSKVKPKQKSVKPRATPAQKKPVPSKSKTGSKEKSPPPPPQGGRPPIYLADIPLLQRPVPPTDQDRPFIIEILSGDDFLRHGDYHKALEKFNEVLSRFRQSPRATFGKAEALEHIAEKKGSNKLMDSAMEYYHNIAYESPIANDDLKLNALSRLANDAHHRSKHSVAVRALQKMYKMEPTNGGYAVRLGEALLKDGQTEKAEEQFRHVLDKWPDNDHAHHHLGSMLYWRKRYEEAVPHLLVGVLKSGDAEQHLLAGNALLRLNRTDEAHQLFEDAAGKSLFPSKWQRSLVNAEGLTARAWWSADQTHHSQQLSALKKLSNDIKREAMAVLDTERRVFIIAGEEAVKLLLFTDSGRNKDGCKLIPTACKLLDQFCEETSCNIGESKVVIIQPNVHVFPSTALNNYSLKIALPLHLSAPVIIRVGGITRDVDNDLVIFDDSFEQELSYHGDQLGLLLLVDLVHPELQTVSS